MNEYPTVRVKLVDVQIGDYHWLGNEIIRIPEYLPKSNQWVFYVESKKLGIIPQYVCGDYLFIQDRNVIEGEYWEIKPKMLMIG